MLDALPIYVAQSRGLLADEDIELVLVPFSAQMDIDTALVGGSVDGAFTDLVRVRSLYERDSLRLSVVTSTAAQWSLIGNQSARLTSLSSMGDKMVAMTRFSATDYLTDKAFEKVKMNAPYFKVQINNVELRLKMLSNDEMDAAWFPEPYATRALLEGHTLLCKSDDYAAGLGVLALRSAFVEQHGGQALVSRIAEIYSMACDTINKYGIEHFGDELQLYCGIDSAIVSHLPECTFAPAAPIDSTLINKIDRFLK